jgi:hypothetical protein
MVQDPKVTKCKIWTMELKMSVHSDATTEYKIIYMLMLKLIIFLTSLIVLFYAFFWSKL